ncbi:hypothetical protein COY27_00145 [Candidatus Woesearchaeota archaeon CG_4_10_14_0_2_um_filter_33_13]|nr:MAG: hypothetical protein COY27_00145 [Candidatus Woesearchaeota archaeon CG_4_10_14_0_2_um_filter_33_13]
MDVQQNTAQPVQQLQQARPVIEQPIYVLPQSKSRALIPKIVILLVLGGIFYLGVLLNLSLLDLTSEVSDVANLTSLILLLCVIILGIFLAVRQAESSYKFYHNKITQGKRDIKYTAISNINPKQDFLDKLFKTYSINLGSNFFLRHLPQEVQISAYLQKLINYAKQSQNIQNNPITSQNGYQTNSYQGRFQ